MLCQLGAWSAPVLQLVVSVCLFTSLFAVMTSPEQELLLHRVGLGTSADDSAMATDHIVNQSDPAAFAAAAPPSASASAPPDSAVETARLAQQTVLAAEVQSLKSTMSQLSSQVSSLQVQLSHPAGSSGAPTVDPGRPSTTPAAEDEDSGPGPDVRQTCEKPAGTEDLVIRVWRDAQHRPQPLEVEMFASVISRFVLAVAHGSASGLGASAK